MTLNLALSNALSGLGVTQSALATTSANITNANTAGYSRKVTQVNTQVLNGLGVGATTELKRIVDDFLSKAQQGQTTSTARAQIVQDYMDRIQVYLGQPDANGSTSIMTALDNFFSAVSNVSGSPELPYFRTQVVQAANTLAQTISNLANNLQQTRYQADQDITASVKGANDSLDRLYTINKAIREASIAGQPLEDLFDQRDKELKNLTQYIDIGTSVQSDGEVLVFNQVSDLLSPSTRYHLSYSGANSVNTLKNDSNLAAINIVTLDDNGNETSSMVQLVGGGKSSAITGKIQDGKILGLMQIRDQQLPAMLAQLDSLAAGLQDAVDTIHNDGVGYPPPSSLTGTTLARGTQDVNFSGKVMIAALNADGTPPASPYANDPGGLYRPLTLDFTKIYGPTGQGEPTLTDVVKEINQYYDSPRNRVQMGPLGDVRLVAISDDTTGPFQFDVEFENPSSSSLDMTIVAVNAVPVGDTVTATPGGITRSSPATYSVAGAGPYSIDVQVQFTDPVTGDAYDETITYNIPAAASGARGDRYGAAALLGGASPPLHGNIVTPSSNQDMLIAQMVDADGNVVANSNTPAYLQLVGQNGLKVGIDELTSTDVGSTTPPIVAGTGLAFSHYFGLNNFFNPQTSSILGKAAEGLSVRQDLISNPNLMSVGELTLSSQPTGTNAQPLYTYGVGIASNQVAERLAALRDTEISFSAAGGLPSYSNSASGYASEIYSYISGAYNTAKNDLTQQNLLQKSYDDRANNVSGVNLDEELANTVLYQNAYSASARIITVVNTLYQALLDAAK